MLEEIIRYIMQYSDIRNITILLLLSLLFSCNVSVKKEIKLEKFYPDGKIESRGITLDGKKNGPATLFYQNGKIKQEGNWENDKQEGLWFFYYDDGSISEKINFKSDYQDGQSTFYFPNGSIDQEIQFTAGKPNGISKTYYRDINKVKQLSKWISGKRNGELIIFDSLGNGSKKYLYKDDQLISEK